MVSRASRGRVPKVFPGSVFLGISLGEPFPQDPWEMLPPKPLGKKEVPQTGGEKLAIKAWYETAKSWLETRYATAKCKREKDIREPLEEEFQTASGRWEVEKYKLLMSRVDGVRSAMQG